VAKIINGLYLVFFSCAFVLTLFQLTSFIHLYILDETPIFIISGFVMISISYVTLKGIVPIVNISSIVYLITVIALILNVILSLDHAVFKNLLPIFNKPFFRYAQGSINSLALDYGEMMIVMMFLNKSGNGLNIRKLFFNATLISLFVLILVHVRETITLGAIGPYLLIPSFESIRLIEVGTLTRIEAVSAMLWIGTLFIKLCIVFQAMLEGVRQVTESEDSNRYILSFAMFFTIYGVSAFITSNINFELNVSAFIGLTFEIVLPLITLILMYIRLFITNKTKETLNGMLR
jgi:spore germination protein KB